MRQSGRRSSIYLVVTVVAILSTIALGAPEPAAAGKCEGCVWKLECEAVGSCWIVEKCSDEYANKMADCWIDQFGYCMMDGGFCRWVSLTPFDDLASPPMQLDRSSVKACAVTTPGSVSTTSPS